MDPLEIQLRRYTRSWKAVFGAACTSALLFLAMASTSIVIHPYRKSEEPPLTYAFVPPPPPPVKTRTQPAVSSSLREAFKFDPSTAGAPPEVPLELLDIGLMPAIDPGVAISLDMQRTFEVAKPEAEKRVVIFERNQVDELPVWLYGPQPKVPLSLAYADWDVVVLYSVSAKGVPENIYVLDSPDPLLGPPVKAAIAGWRFRPARKAGKPVMVWVQQTVTQTSAGKSPFSL